VKRTSYEAAHYAVFSKLPPPCSSREFIPSWLRAPQISHGL